MKTQSRISTALQMTAAHLGGQLGIATSDVRRRPDFEIYKGTKLGAKMALSAMFSAALYAEIPVRELAMAARKAFLETSCK